MVGTNTDADLIRLNAKFALRNLFTKDRTGLILKILCGECKRETRHEVVTSTSHSGTEYLDEGFSISYREIDEVVKCLGCSTISFRRETSNSEDMDENGYVSLEEIFPKKSKDIIDLSISMNSPPVLRRIFRETIDCYINNDFSLCATGIRAIIECLCKEKKIKSGLVEIKDKNGQLVKKRRTDLQGKINGLFDHGLLTKKNANYLHQHRLLGNEAIHELKIPTRNELRLALSIACNIIENIYDIPKMANALKTEKRKRK